MKPEDARFAVDMCSEVIDYSRAAKTQLDLMWSSLTAMKTHVVLPESEHKTATEAIERMMKILDAIGAGLVIRTANVYALVQTEILDVAIDGNYIDASIQLQLID